MNNDFIQNIPSGIARRRKVGGHKLFSGKSEKKKKKGHSGVKALIMLFRFFKLLGLCAICIKIVLKGGFGGPPPENFYRIRYKIRQF